MMLVQFNARGHLLKNITMASKNAGWPSEFFEMTFSLLNQYF
jgi:hypothetical protein